MGFSPCTCERQPSTLISGLERQVDYTSDASKFPITMSIREGKRTEECKFLEANEMRFNIDKCKIMHPGKPSPALI